MSQVNVGETWDVAMIGSRRSRSGRLLSGRDSSRGVAAGLSLERHSHFRPGKEKLTPRAAKTSERSSGSERADELTDAQQQLERTGWTQQSSARFARLPVDIDADTSPASDSITPLATKTSQTSRR
jgi:hypothetical protein